MDQRIDLITLGVADLTASRRFYVDGLRWRVVFEVPGEVVFLQVNHGLLLSLFGADALETDVTGRSERPAQAGPPPMSLAQIVKTEDEVRAICERVRALGAPILKEPQHADFGGFHCYFADPSGFRWEVATNSGWRVFPDGRVAIGPIE
jgi:uncharacterized protein